MIFHIVSRQIKGKGSEAEYSTTDVEPFKYHKTNAKFDDLKPSEGGLSTRKKFFDEVISHCQSLACDSERPGKPKSVNLVFCRTWLQYLDKRLR